MADRSARQVGGAGDDLRSIPALFARLIHGLEVGIIGWRWVAMGWQKVVRLSGWEGVFRRAVPLWGRGQCQPGIAPFFESAFVSGWGTGSNEMHFRKTVQKRCRNGAILR
jgi:hypothetical protein